MKHLLTALCLTLAGPAAADCTGPSLLDAQPQAAARMRAEAAAVPHADGLVWTAEAPDGTHLTLVGTFHGFDPRQAQQIADLDAALTEADLLVAEATPGDVQAMQTRLLTDLDLAFLTEAPTLLNRLGEDDWALLAPQMLRRGIPPFLAAKFRPWYATMVLAMPPCMMRDAAQKRMGLDFQLMAEAQERGLPITGLDDVQGLIDLLASGTLGEQTDVLRGSLRAGSFEDSNIATMLDLYYQGRGWEAFRFPLYFTEGMTKDEKALLAQQYDFMSAALLDDRNRAWIAPLLAATRGKTAVVAVGIAHMSGEAGLLRLLEGEGFTVRVDR